MFFKFLIYFMIATVPFFVLSNDLAFAVKTRDYALVKQLLDAGADINQQFCHTHDEQDDCWRSIEFAIMDEDVLMVELLLARGVDVKLPCGLYANAVAYAGRIARWCYLAEPSPAAMQIFDMLKERWARDYPSEDF